MSERAPGSHAERPRTSAIEGGSREVPQGPVGEASVAQIAEARAKLPTPNESAHASHHHEEPHSENHGGHHGHGGVIGAGASVFSFIKLLFVLGWEGLKSAPWGDLLKSGGGGGKSGGHGGGHDSHGGGHH